MKNWKIEIDKAASKMETEMQKANVPADKLELLNSVVSGLKSDLDKHARTDFAVYGYQTPQKYVANVYGMSGKFADHGSLKHVIAANLAKLM